MSYVCELFDILEKGQTILQSMAQISEQRSWLESPAASCLDGREEKKPKNLV